MPHCVTVSSEPEEVLTCPLLAALKPDGQVTTIFTATPVFWPDTEQTIRSTTTEHGLKKL